jgi:hypothetical protein
MQPASLRSDDGRFTENHLVAFSKLRNDRESFNERPREPPRDLCSHQRALVARRGAGSSP